MNFERVWRRVALWMSACVLLAACGGGGNDGGFRVSLNRSSVQVSYERGRVPAPVSLRATWSGQPPDTVYIGAVVEGQGIEPAIPVTLTSNYADITLTPRANLPVGQHSGRVLAMVCADAACSRPIGGTPLPIAYTVTVVQGLSLAPSSLTFAAVENTTAPTQSLGVTLPTGSTAEPAVALQYAGTGGWLTVNRTASGYSVSASAAALPRGVYTATVIFTPAAPYSSVEVPVSLTVGPGLVAPAPALHTVSAETTAASLAGSAPVNLAAGPVLSWTASSSAAWLRLTTASGTTGSSLAYTIDPAGLQPLDNFSDHTATVTLSSSLAHVTPVTFTVTVRKQLPEVNGVGPYVVVAGRSSQVVVRGRGFGSVIDVPARLQTSGLAVSSVARVSDTELILQAAPAEATDRRLSFSNALGLDGGAAVLRVVAPQPYAYAAVPTTGTKRAMVLDAQRGVVYAPNVSQSRLDRYRFGGATGWAADGVAVDNILDAGLSPDGQSLVVTSTPGALRLLDPTSLVEQFRLDHAAGFSRYFTYESPGIASTNDGRSWLAVGNTGWNDLVYFDHATRTIRPSVLASGVRTSYYGGPWAHVSRNGERLLVSQSASISPQPPMLYLDARDSLLRVNPGGKEFAYGASMSDDGSRALFDARELRDADFNVLGQVTVPWSTGYFGLVGSLSPDGRRAYVLAYHEAAISEFPVAYLPRVFVFDTTSITAGESALLGHFDLAHYPTCRTRAYECVLRARTAISPDGLTLFYIGDAHLVVAPVPVNFQSPVAGGGSNDGVIRQGAVIRRWDIGSRR